MRTPILLLIGFAITSSLALPGARAATALTWDTTNSTGFLQGNGTWDFNSTADWSTDGTTLLKWTDNTDYATFTNAASATLTLNDATGGQVGVGGLIFASGANAKTLTINGNTASDSLQLGAGGIVVSGSAGTMAINAPLVLTASQTWSSTHGLIKVGGGVSSLSGTTNLVIDGRGVSGAGFELSGTSSLNGSVTVTGGGTLNLDYASGATPRLGGTLILAGGTVSLTGGVSYLEAVSNLVVGPGGNSILDTNGVGASLSVSGITHVMGGTLIANNGANTGLAIATTANDASGIIGAWAIAGNGYWMKAAGTTVSTSAMSGTTTPGDPSTWSGTTLSRYTGTGFTGGVSASVLDLLIGGTTTVTQGVSLGFASGLTLTVVGGGISDINAGGATITGGSITSGQTDGELYLYNSTTAVSAFTINSAIIDNGTNPTSLVVYGTTINATNINSFVLGGVNTYTGATYVNGGILKLAAGGSISQSKAYVVGAKATLDVTATGLTVGITSAGVHQQLNGGGTVLGAVTVASGGTIAPATFIPTAAGGTQVQTANLLIGSSTSAGSLTLNSGSALTFYIGTNSDQITLLGSTGSTLTIGGTITLNLFDAGGVGQQSYTLMQWQTNTTLNGMDIADFHVVTNDGITGTLSLGANSLIFTVASVPEPGTWLLLAGGLAVLFLPLARRAGKKLSVVHSA